MQKPKYFTREEIQYIVDMITHDRVIVRDNAFVYLDEFTKLDRGGIIELTLALYAQARVPVPARITNLFMRGTMLQ